MRVIISIFSRANFNETKFELARRFLELRNDVQIESIPISEYIAMSHHEKFQWGVLGSYLTWKENGLIYRYANKATR